MIKKNHTTIKPYREIEACMSRSLGLSVRPGDDADVITRILSERGFYNKGFISLIKRVVIEMRLWPQFNNRSLVDCVDLALTTYSQCEAPR